MALITYPITLIDKSRAAVSLSKSIYTIEALHASAYKFSGEYFIHITENEEMYQLLFERKDNGDIDDISVKTICNDVIDQQIRIETEKQYGYIRDLIVEEAFKPVNKVNK